MRIEQATVLEVVKEASGKMSDANYSAVMVGGFVQTQGPSAQYISAHATELGGPEGVVNTIFHAALIALCFQRANRRSVRRIRFDELDHVAGGRGRGQPVAELRHALDHGGARLGRVHDPGVPSEAEHPAGDPLETLAV